MFLKFILRAMKYRRQRLLLAFAALAVAAALAAVLFNVYGAVERRLGSEFAAYGANILAAPRTGDSVPLEVVEAARRMGAIAAPFFLASGHIGKDDVLLAGFEPAATAPLTLYWHLDGTRDIGEGDCLAGESLATRLSLKTGSTIALAGGPCTLKGIVSTGGAEDQEMLVPFARAARGREYASFIEIRAEGARLAAMRRDLGAQFPTVDFRENRAVVDTESGVILKIRASVVMLTILVLVITTLCVTGNFTELVLERAKEIAILKSIGAADRPIAAFFVVEAAALALAATLAGYLAGLVAAAGVTRGIFGGGFRIEADWMAFGGVALVMLAVATIATAIATSRIRSIEPAVVLRGE